MTLLRDLVDIPEVVHRGDFVLRLTEGVANPEATLDTYVVTDQVASCFDHALSLIRNAVKGNTSKAAYLHGSFGSGKSHFMAVLDLLLAGNVGARSIPALGPVVAKHDDWLAKDKFLLVPIHMLGKKSMEEAIFGGYTEHVRKLQPDAPLPGVLRAEALLDDAERMREQLGDDAFFDMLNTHGAPDSGWGDLAAGWDPESYDSALRAEPNDPEQERLVGALLDRLFPSYRDVVAGAEGAYVPLDRGLSAISRHAHGLGYDGIVLFLDELILWLASMIADMTFVSKEGQKLVTLVEAQTQERPVPIVSFIARQRDLRELIGDYVPGAQELSFGDVLNYGEGRFDTISLEDRNLVAIAEKRVLAPRNDAARIQIDDAFERTAPTRADLLAVLEAAQSRDDFRRVYPFSPAFVQTLVAVSSALQRERTALKIMVQLLVDQRDTLELGELVPVGDLFDYVAAGEEVVAADMRAHLENARRLYREKLRPLLLADHGLTDDALETADPASPEMTAFRADDRIAKTLLLAALAPEVPALRGLTPIKLAALNHGTITAPIPGQESQIALTKVRNWAGQVGEIRIGESDNPEITLQLTGVDTSVILDQVRSIDTPGNRRQMVRRLLLEQLGIPETDSMFITHTFTWRGTKRSVDVLFGNIRDAAALPDDSLRTQGDDRRIVIDFPFDDDEARGPHDDEARVESLKADGVVANTLLWIPSFFSAALKRDLGELVKIDHVLKGERFDDAAKSLPAVDRQAARQMLDSQRSQLRERIRSALLAAYGLAAPTPRTVDPSKEPNEHFWTLDPSFTPRPPAAATMQTGFESLAAQQLAHLFPAHPEFGADIKLAALKKVLDEVRRATQAENGRIEVDDRSVRPLLRNIAQPLHLGEMHEVPFLLSDHWKDHFRQAAAADGSPVTVEKLREWIDHPRRMGLPREVQNLVILVYADQTNGSFYLHGGAQEPDLSDLPDACELREQQLPDQDDWEEAIRRAGTLFGLAPPSNLRSATSVAKLSSDVAEYVAARTQSCVDLIAVLEPPMQRLGLLAGDVVPDRLATARAARDLVEKFGEADPADLITRLARADVGRRADALARSIASADTVASGVREARWEFIDALTRLTDDRQEAAQALLRQLEEALGSDELAIGLAPKLKTLEGEAALILAGPTRSKTTERKHPGRRRIAGGDSADLDPDTAREVLDEIGGHLAPGRALTISWSISEETADR